MAQHDKLAALFGDGIFFAHPASPWQRPSNENTNGLLRQYLPRCADFRAITPEALEMIAVELNGRPRETLGWRTPAERFLELQQASP